MSRIKLNGKVIPPFVIVSKVSRSILPPINQTMVHLSGRNRGMVLPPTFGTRMFQLEFGIAATSKQDLRSKVQQLSEWLYHDKVKPLVFPEEQDKYYLVKVTGETDLVETWHTGRGTIHFTCRDPFAYGKKNKVPFRSSTSHVIEIENKGNLATYPQLELTFTKSTTQLTIANGKERLAFGKPCAVDQTSVPSKTLIFQDNCSSVVGWTTGVGVDGGNVTGTFESTGDLRPSAYGQGSTWHGPAGIKTFKKTLQDFTLETHIGFKSVKAPQVGRVEIYLLDINNTRIGKVAMRDSVTTANSPVLEACAGSSRDGHYFVRTGVGKGYYNLFYGRLTLQRIGPWWYFGIGKKDAKGNYWGRWSAKYFDKEQKYRTPVAGIQIHIGTFGNHPPYSTVYISNLKVWEENTIQSKTEVPYIFEKGDKLFIDHEKGAIVKNGEPFFYELDPSSHFFQLQRGMNQLKITSTGTAKGTITYHERWLS